MKILVVVDSINIEDSSGSKSNVALIDNLTAGGFEVLVYHYTLKNIQLSAINPTYAIPELKFSPLYFLSRLQRLIQRNFRVNLAPFLEGLFGFSFTFFNDTNSIVRALKKCDFAPDLVLTLSKGASFRPHYAVLQLPQFHSKWMAYVHDPYPFHYNPRPYNWIETSYQDKEKFFTEVSEKAEYSAFPSLMLKEWMGSYFPNFLKTGVLIPHQNAKQKMHNIELPEYFDDRKFTVLHAGNLIKQRSPQGLLKGFKLFLKQNPTAVQDSKLILLGNAAYHSDMLTAYGKDNSTMYIYNGNVPFDTVYTLQQKVTVNVILESKSEISPFLPAKFPHCLEANKAILSLAPYYSETKRLLGNDYPYWSEVDDVNKIASIISEMYQLWQQNPDQLLLNRKDLVRYFSFEYLKKIILSLQSNS